MQDDFLFYMIMVCCVYSFESPQQGNADEETQNTFMLKKYPYYASWPGTIINTHMLQLPVVNIFSWFQRCSSHWCLYIILSFKHTPRLGLIGSKMKVDVQTEINMPLNFSKAGEKYF